MMRRRSVLRLGLGGIGLTAMSSASVWAQDDPALAPPKEGDFLVRLDDSASKPIGPADVIAQAPPLMAWPMDPASKTVRKANRLNQVLLIRLNPAAAGNAQPNAVDGVLAYSGLCPHAGCDLTNWMAETGILSCDCHSSEFDAQANGRVVGGPASRSLPSLILKSDGTVFVVAKPFATPIRFDEQG
jgi:rieske iron-sulfur protein